MWFATYKVLGNSDIPVFVAVNWHIILVSNSVTFSYKESWLCQGTMHLGHLNFPQFLLDMCSQNLLSSILKSSTRCHRLCSLYSTMELKILLLPIEHRIYTLTQLPQAILHLMSLISGNHYSLLSSFEMSFFSDFYIWVRSCGFVFLSLICFT